MAGRGNTGGGEEAESTDHTRHNDSCTGPDFLSQYTYDSMISLVIRYDIIFTDLVIDRL